MITVYRWLVWISIARSKAWGWKFDFFILSPTVFGFQILSVFVAFLQSNLNVLVISSKTCLYNISQIFSQIFFLPPGSCGSSLVWLIPLPWYPLYPQAFLFPFLKWSHQRPILRTNYNFAQLINLFSAPNLAISRRKKDDDHQFAVKGANKKR